MHVPTRSSEDLSPPSRCWIGQRVESFCSPVCHVAPFDAKKTRRPHSETLAHQCAWRFTKSFVFAREIDHFFGALVALPSSILRQRAEEANYYQAERIGLGLLLLHDLSRQIAPRLGRCAFNRRPLLRRGIMLYWALIFLVVALVAALFGFGGIAAGAAGIAKILFFVFLVLFIVSLVAGGLRRPTI